MLRYVVLALLLMLGMTAPASAQTNSCTLVNTGAYQDFTLFSDPCKRVTNNSGTTVCVTTADASMWSSFWNNPPSGVTVTSCSACGTNMVSSGGYCYVWGGQSASCDTACASYGGCHLTGTRAIGSSGTDAACQAVAAAFYPTYTWGGNGTTAVIGCNSYTDKYGTTAYRWTGTTTCAATYSMYSRFCACNNAGASCTLPWGGTLAHGSSVTAYQYACGSGCPSETRTCTDGTLSGSYTNSSCAGSCSSCTLPWGGSISHGACTTAYTASAANNCSGCCCDCSQFEETRCCDNGTLSGSGNNASCSDICIPCFTADTEITMADGSKKPISQLRVGDKVRGAKGINTVQRVATPLVNKPIYAFNGGKGFVTAGHPFMTRDGWKAIDPLHTPNEGHGVKTSKLEIGDEILREDGATLKIDSIDVKGNGKRTVYNPSVDGDNTYYANGLLAHNKDAECF